MCAPEMEWGGGTGCAIGTGWYRMKKQVLALKILILAQKWREGRKGDESSKKQMQLLTSFV